MAGQPDACTVTAVLQRFVQIETWRSASRQHSANLPCLWRCWQRVEESNNQPKLHRLHLVSTDAASLQYRDHPAYPERSAIGLLWGHALDGKEKPVWKVRPIKDGWQPPTCLWRRSTPFNLLVGLSCTQILAIAPSACAFSLHSGLRR